MGKAAKWGAGKLKNLASKALPKFKTTLQESAGKFVSKISGAFSSPSSSGSGMRNRNRGYIYGTVGTKTANGGVTLPTEKDVKQLYEYIVNGKYH